MTNSSRRVIAVMEDLMFLVKIQDTAKKAGLETVAVKSKSLAFDKAVEGALLVIIDLNYTPAEPLELIQQLKAAEGTKGIHLLAFVSHVQADLRAEASARGCDTVVPRSAFAERLPVVIQSCLAAEQG